jgi:hypothetical protein
MPVGVRIADPRIHFSVAGAFLHLERILCSGANFKTIRWGCLSLIVGSVIVLKRNRPCPLENVVAKHARGKPCQGN